MLSWDVKTLPWNTCCITLYSHEMVGKTLPQVPVSDRAVVQPSLNNSEELRHLLQDEKFIFLTWHTAQNLLQDIPECFEWTNFYKTMIISQNEGFILIHTLPKKRYWRRVTARNEVTVINELKLCAECPPSQLYNYQTSCLQLYTYLIGVVQKGRIILFIWRLASVGCQICSFLKVTQPLRYKQDTLIIFEYAIPFESPTIPSTPPDLQQNVFKRQKFLFRNNLAIS